MLAVVVVVASVTILLRGGGPARAPGDHRPAALPTPVTRMSLGLLPVRTADVGGAPASLVWTAGGVWVADGRRVLRVDPSSLATANSLPQSAQCDDSQIGAGFGSVWLVSGHCMKPGVLTRIDPSTGRSAWQVRIPAFTEGVADWAAGRRVVVTTLNGGARWALAEIDPANRRITPLSERRSGGNLTGAGLTTLVATPAGLWAEPTGMDGVARIVLHGRQVTTDVLYSTQPKAGLAYGDGIVFAGLGPEVLQLDPGSGDQIAPPLKPPGVITAVAYGDSNAWIATSDGRLYRYPPGDRGLALAARLPWRATSLATGGGYLWAANYTSGRLARIGPAPLP
jgi:hypothetical protein